MLNISVRNIDIHSRACCLKVQLFLFESVSKMLGSHIFLLSILTFVYGALLFDFDPYKRG